MRTIEDLQQSLAQRAGAAPDGTGMVERARDGAVRIRRRRRVLQGAATVVAVAVAAVTVPLALRQDTAPPAAEAPPFRDVTQLSLTTVPGSDFVVPWRQSVPGEESGLVSHRAELTAERPEELTVNQGAGFEVFDPGAYDPANLRAGTPVTVADRQAWYVPDLPIEEDMTPFDGVSAPAGSTGPALGWQETSGAWVLLFRRHLTASTRAELIEVARNVRIQDPLRQVAAPYRFGWLAPGLRVAGLQVRDLRQLSGAATVAYDYGDDRPAGRPAMIVYAGAAAGDRDWEMIDKELTTPRKAGGHDVWYLEEPNRALEPVDGGSIVVVDTGRCHIQLNIADRTRIPKQDAVRMAEELTATDCADVSTWMPLAG
ncbi:hypothetical protein [Actinoplanes sp. NPDC023714]|uniref:hypothetical protein n=1 Tax=Actinoplanes sp. NPDC023714 TaxID=3154322 RepID=UPI0033CF7574